MEGYWLMPSTTKVAPNLFCFICFVENAVDLMIARVFGHVNRRIYLVIPQPTRIELSRRQVNNVVIAEDESVVMVFTNIGMQSPASENVK